MNGSKDARRVNRVRLGLRLSAPGTAFVLGLSMLLLATWPEAEDAYAVALPVALQGTANINGFAAPDSSIITVTVSGDPCVTSPAIVRPSGGNYLLAILYAFDGPCSSAGPTELFIDGILAASRPGIVGPTATVNLNAPFGSLTPTATGASPTSTPTGVLSTATSTSTSTPGQVFTPTSISSPTATPQSPTPSPTAGTPLGRAYVPFLARD